MQVQDKYAACMSALKDYVSSAGFSEVLVGLSGGIDSCVTAVLCVDAFGADKVHGVLLPGPYSSEHSISDAQELAERLGIETRIVSIVDAYQAFAGALAEVCGGTLVGTAAENTQARCRMVCLMAISNAQGWMLVNTGNKSEACMGYSTLYGDTAGAFAPIGGLYKTDVYAIGRWRNEEAARAGEVPPIPEQVFTKPPSAELSEGQRDEASLGITYAELDKILIGTVEQGKSPEEMAGEGFDADEVRRISARVASFAYKRTMEPPFPTNDFYA